MTAPSFNTRVLLVVLLLAAIVLVPILLAIDRGIRASVTEQASEKLAIGARVFSQLMRDREAQLLSTVQVVAADFGFKEAVATEDTATVLSVLDNHGGRIGASEALVASLSGDVLTSTIGLSKTAIVSLLPRLIEEANRRGHAHAIVPLASVPHQLVMVPLRAPRPIAWVVMGFRMNADLAARLKAQTRLEVSFTQDAQRNEDAAVPLKSSLASRDGFASEAGPGVGAGAAFVTRTGRRKFLTLELPLDVYGRGVSAVLRASLDDTWRPYIELRNRVTVISLLTLAAALATALVLSRGVTRPVERLADAAKRIGQGDYQQLVDFRRGDELGSLAAAFNNMQGAIAEREDKIAHQAFHDVLTGLPNRALANDRLQLAMERARRNGHTVGVLMIDVDRFKEINDTLGHQTGDQLLIEIARRLKNAVRASDTVARLGGDEFLVLVESQNLDAAMTVGAKLASVVAQPMMIEDVEVNTELSIGVCVYPDHGDDAEVLLRRADIAMYEAKASRQSPSAYQPGREERHLYRLALINDLRRAIPNNELAVHFQPKVDFRTGRVTHVEALMRWRHPRYGMVPPDEFIPLAESSGRIRQLTAWLLDTVVEQCGDWQRQGFAVGVAINVSLVDLASIDLAPLVTNCLSKHGLDPDQLIIEITESAAMRDSVNTIEILQRLRNAGVKLAIDDFGTGYSSLSQLKRMPVDELKIDKSFVLGLAKDDEDEVIVRSTIELGHNMGLRVVAEGVEDERTWEMLRASHCDMAQGFLISKPLPLDELIPWLECFNASPPAWGENAGRVLEKKAV